MNRMLVVVEDDPLARDSAVETLTELGFPIADFSNADAALDFLDEHASEVFVLFTDIRMPGSINGIGLAARARQRWPWIKILIASGALESADLPLPRDVKLVAKPWLAADVLDTVYAWADGRSPPRAASQ